MAGAIAGVVVGSRVAAAQACTAHYHPCAGDGDCCAGAVCEYGLCMPGCRIEGTFYSPWSMPPGDICQVCSPEISTTSWTPANDGMSCWSGDPNAGVTTCRSGVCSGNEAVDCRPQTVCHTAAINAVTGQCEQGFAEAGTTCGAEAMCHGGFFQPADTCDGNGFCIGGGAKTVGCAPYLCGPDACTTSCETDADCASNAHCDDGLCFVDLGLGEPCDEDSDCQNGICSNGVCCDQRCDSLCATCSAQTGGYCSPVTCDDGLSCITGTCDESTGACSQALNPGACLIAGVCYTTGAVNPGYSCQVCAPEANTEGWSPRCPDSSCLNGVCFPHVTGEVKEDSEYHGVCTTTNGYYWSTVPYTFSHEGGPIEIGVRGEQGGGGTLFNPSLDLYTEYDPEPQCMQCCEGHIAYDSNSGCGWDEYLSLDDLAPGSYTAVVSGTSVTHFGTFTLTFGQGPAEGPDCF